MFKVLCSFAGISAIVDSPKGRCRTAIRHSILDGSKGMYVC